MSDECVLFGHSWHRFFEENLWRFGIWAFELTCFFVSLVSFFRVGNTAEFKPIKGHRNDFCFILSAARADPPAMIMHLPKRIWKDLVSRMHRKLKWKFANDYSIGKWSRDQNAHLQADVRLPLGPHTNKMTSEVSKDGLQLEVKFSKSEPTTSRTTSHTLFISPNVGFWRHIVEETQKKWCFEFVAKGRSNHL